MDLKFSYDTYQDVRRNIFLYSVPFFVIAGFFLYLFILPHNHQQAIIQIIEYVSSIQPWKNVIGIGLGLAIFVGIAFVFAELIQIHDQWYDKYVIRWRYSYAIDFILPRLVQPFASHLNYRFYETAEDHVREFQERLYYPFVGDRDSKIPKNRLVRFYEVVTVYWLTQINELTLLLLLASVGFYRFKSPAELTYRSMLLTDLLVLCGLFALNRMWARFSKAKVRRATEEEIRAIHDNAELLKALGERLVKLCSDYSIPYAKNSQD